MEDPTLPEPLRARLARLVDDVDALVETLTSERPPDLRLNTLKADPDRVLEAAREAGLVLDPLPWAPHAYRVREGTPGTTLPHFLGWIYVQSGTSMLPPLAVRDRLDDADVLDACAAPGSKTTQLAQLMDNRGTIVANDVAEGRIAALKNNLGRCGVTNAVITHRDVRGIDWSARFDVTLVDAPCSAEGILRKSWGPLDHWSEHHVRSLGGVQKQLLERAWDLTRDGGTIVYSTCTFAPEENEAVVDHLLRTRGGEVVPVDVDGLTTRPGVTAWGDATYDETLRDAVRVYPHDDDTDGFFLAVVAT